MPAHETVCGCCADLLRSRFDRRRFLHLAAGAGAIAAFPSFVFARDNYQTVYEAMLLTCIDPRFPGLTFNYMQGRGMVGKYSQFSLAGSAIGVVAPTFKAWQPAFWENLGASIQLHRIPKVIAINHRDCGAARIAYGAERVDGAEKETLTHKAALAEFRGEVAKRHPALQVETGLMGIDGKIEMLA